VRGHLLPNRNRKEKEEKKKRLEATKFGSLPLFGSFLAFGLLLKSSAAFPTDEDEDEDEAS
jgi:hypothetical protein